MKNSNRFAIAGSSFLPFYPSVCFLQIETNSCLRPQFSDVLLLVFGATCQQGSSVTPKCHSARIITITAFVILMFLYAIYLMRARIEYKS